ncbi:hypothetical protein Poli38472_013753 [Pythium oligandrum]|uniref:CSC1/OSCA1-like 7TM region domain-containing protein n=1 Tax=Pythium oligandrum TaxID=41045 RepID=A0A8K1FF60_PYTOL|nr:hypothetical protein Poli38472_013753 [Pythium oligandrum]|eukprot:TMW61290.1 hypothetical protein Poli38472_013753 [Pythium oligandrum]
MDDDELIDATLGTLPTLIVPDDPVNGAIEKPKTPPPSAPPSARAATAREEQHAEEERKEPDAVEVPVEVVPVVVDTAPPVTAQEPLPPITAVEVEQSINSKDYRGMAKRAIGLAKMDRLAGGNKSVFDAEMSDIGALGIGMQLYFMLTKYLAITFLIMGIVALPTIVLNKYGNGVTDSMVDPLELAYASLGNEGVHPEVKADSSLCLPKGDIDCNWTTVNTPFTSDPVTVSWIITISDVVYSTAFFVFYLVYRYRARKAIDTHMNENLTPAKYAVFVRGLPPDATEVEILQHFNQLYDLTKDEEASPLWCGCCWGRRRKVKTSFSRNAVNRNTVKNIDHLACTIQPKKDLYVDTWIAEISIGHPTGGLLRTFLSMEALTRSIAETQELVRILEKEKEEASTFSGGGKNKCFKPSDEKLLQASVKKLALLNERLAKKTSKIKALKQGQKRTESIQAIENPTNKKNLKASMKAAKRAAKKAAEATQHGFNWNACECAFVVFNNLESRRRCLQDYRRSGNWLARRYQPKVLRFRDGKYPLIVRPAPEPSNILWENLEVTDRGRFYRRSFTNFVTFLLLLFSAGIISAAQSTQQDMKKKMVTPDFCDSTLPLVYYGNLSYLSRTDLTWQLAWDANATCTPGTKNETRYHIAYNNSIVNDLHITTPAYWPANGGERTRCVDPCISETSTRTCHSMACFDQDIVDEGETCETYPEANILYCFCKDALTESIDQKGFYEGPKDLWSRYVPCRNFIRDYLIRNAFLYLAAGIVVIVNMLLKAILRAFATFEAHSSESAKASAIAIKMFGAQFLNTAIIVLIVNAAMNLNGLPLLKDLFKGKYKDFEREWYPTVGMGITMTMLINAFVPQIVLFVQMFLVAPVQRCLKRRSIRTQDQMNKLYAGPTFDISIRYPMVLNSVFVTMVFCGGSPILLFIASLTAAGTFWFDKLSVIHLYSVKTAYDEELGETALSVLPWTLALHLAFSTWMYGNTDLMKSRTINLDTMFRLLNIQVVEANGTAVSPTDLYNEFITETSKIKIVGDVVVRIVHSNVLVVFLLFTALVLWLLLSTVFTRLLLPILTRTFGVILQPIGRKIKQAWARRAARKKATAKVHAENKISPPKSTQVTTPAPSPPPQAEASNDTTNVAIPVDTTPVKDDAPEAQPPEGLSSLPIPPLSPKGKQKTLVSMLSPRSARVELILPEYTDYFRKTVPRRYNPDKQLGFEKNSEGQLIRVWQEETIQHGLKRLKGEHMRTWEAMQAPVKSYAIEANSKYKLAVMEIMAAAERLRVAAEEALAAPPATTPTINPTEEKILDVDAAIAATEPISVAVEQPLEAPADVAEPTDELVLAAPTDMDGGHQDDPELQVSFTS